MSDKSLKDKAVSIKGRQYVLVADRILYFNDNHKNGAIITEELENEQRVEFKATVIPNVDKPERKFTGHSQAVWGDGMVNKTAATENAETSAVGRALAMMGIGVIESVASADEIHKAQTQPITDKLATPKQIDWMRATARAVSGLEEQSDVDEWIKQILTIPPQHVPIKKVKAAVDHMIAQKETSKPIVADDMEISDEDLKKAKDGTLLDELPY